MGRINFEADPQLFSINQLMERGEGLLKKEIFQVKRKYKESKYVKFRFKKMDDSTGNYDSEATLYLCQFIDIT
jgi:hypothetical protein